MSAESTLDLSLREAQRQHVAAQLPNLGWVVAGSSIMWFVLAPVAAAASMGAMLPLGVQCAIVLLQGMAFAAATVLCRRHPTGHWVVPLAVAVCFAIGLLWIWLLTVTARLTAMLMFATLTLFSAAPLVLAWGLGPQLVFQGGLTVVWIGALVVLPRHLPMAELASVISVGNFLAIFATQWATSAFRAEVLGRFAALEFDRRLADSREAYRALAENASDFIWAMDRDARWTYVNEALARRCGVTVAGMVGRPATEILATDDENPDPRVLIEAFVAGDDVTPRVFKMMTPDGPCWVEAVATLVHGSDGAVVGVQGVSRDITERRQAEDALRASERRFRSFAESMAAGVLIAQQQGIVYVNAAATAITGYEREELLRMQVWDLVHVDERAMARARVMARIDGAPLLPRTAYRLATKSGEPRWVDITVAMLELDGVPSMLGTALDVTEQRLSEHSLRASEARYRGLVESQSELVLRFEAHGCVTFANDAYCHTYGLRRADAIGRPFWPLVHPADIGALRTAVAATMQPPYRVKVEVRSRTTAGWRWFEWEASAVRDSLGVVLEGQATGRDVTERRRAQEDLQASLEQLRRSEEKLHLLAQRQVAIREEERKRLSFDLHDDVCQELVGVSILVDSVAGRVASQVPEATQDLERATRHLREVVEHLRVLAHELRPMLLHDLGLEGGLRSLAAGLSSEMTAVQTVFATAIPRLDDPLEVTVYRVAQEAIANALRHAGACRVTVTLAVKDERVHLEVRDDGCGFDVAGDGRAFGLGSMKERALSLGGRLTVSSRPGTGTTIVLDCPLGIRSNASAA